MKDVWNGSIDIRSIGLQVKSGFGSGGHCNYSPMAQDEMPRMLQASRM